MKCSGVWENGIWGTYFEEDDSRKDRMNENLLGKVGDEPARDEIFNHKLDEAGRGLHALKPGKRETSDAAAGYVLMYMQQEPGYERLRRYQHNDIVPSRSKETTK